MEKKNNEGIRINKYISDYGFCSRREADKLIEDERVTINNRLATPGDRVTESDNIRIDGEHLAFVPREARPKKHRWGPPRNVETAEVFAKSEVKVWECRNCGHIVVGKKAPQICPTCAHPQSYFEVHAENY